MRNAMMEIYTSDFTQKKVIRDLFLWTFGQNSQMTIKKTFIINVRTRTNISSGKKITRKRTFKMLLINRNFLINLLADRTCKFSQTSLILGYFVGKTWDRYPIQFLSLRKHYSDIQYYAILEHLYVMGVVHALDWLLINT